MLAEEVRSLMASLGFRRFDDMVGRSDLLETDGAITFWKARGLDFSRLLTPAEAPAAERRQTRSQEHGIGNSLDNEILPRVRTAIDSGGKAAVSMRIRNTHRTIGTIISSEIATKYGHRGLPDDSITLNFSGSAGQSFGAFCARGMTLVLEGEANDYLGKGLSGARIVVRPPPGSTFDPALNMIAGNVVLYGATAGEAYINGRAGERFAIRNSGALAVVEGVGDHGCEYMTGGRIAILGCTGVNFGAGMSGGLAYVYDETGDFDCRCNLDMIDLEPVALPADIKELQELLRRHVKYTGSPRAAKIIEAWDSALPRFVKVFPMEYRRVLGQMSREDEQTERAEGVRE
jgi:glutamate synthase (NADPH/NADH) large chain